MTLQELRNQALHLPISDRCGCEYGYDDYPKYREEWIRKGSPWFDQKERPQDWNLEEQLKYIIVAWNVDR